MPLSKKEKVAKLKKARHEIKQLKDKENKIYNKTLKHVGLDDDDTNFDYFFNGYGEPAQLLRRQERKDL